MNMILHDNPTALIMSGNTLTDPKYRNGDALKTFHFVVANPPFSDKRWSNGLDPANDAFERFQPFGTPLLAKDRATSLEVFGGYIHTYNFSEGVEHGVVLDLVYEARDIDQRLGSEDKIDAWFEAKTRGLNNWQKDELKQKWGTMQNVLNSRPRVDRVVSDIVFDFSVKPRLSGERGNAILVASSIHEARKYFALFQNTPFRGKCAVVTSYNPLAKDVTLEETGANTDTDKQFIYNTYTELLKDVDARPGMTKTESYEEHAKGLFTKEPANMKLLVVVDKPLTGFGAPPCTYLYSGGRCGAIERGCTSPPERVSPPVRCPREQCRMAPRTPRGVASDSINRRETLSRFTFCAFMFNRLGVIAVRRSQP